MNGNSWYCLKHICFEKYNNSHNWIIIWIDIRGELRNPESKYHVTPSHNKWQVKLPNIFSKGPISDDHKGPKLNTEHITEIYE